MNMVFKSDFWSRALLKKNTLYDLPDRLTRSSIYYATKMVEKRRKRSKTIENDDEDTMESH